jgi:glycosyltransferase involved in cell wall biosynthesis
MRSARVGFISSMDSASWGGSEELWSQAAMRLLSEGYEVSASVKQWPEEAPAIRQLRAAGCRIQYRRRPTVRERLLRRVWPDRPYTWLNEFRPQLAVISQGANADGLPWMDACFARRIPYVTIAQAATPMWWPDDRELPCLVDALNRACACFFVSRANIELTERQLATRLPSAEVVRNPFRVLHSPPLPWPRNGHVRMACVAAFEPHRKGHDLLFGALGEPKWRARPVTVTVYGKGHAEQGLRGLKDLLDLPMLEFGGFAEPSEIWAKEQLLVLPSRYEGLPIALVEAMLSGRPAVVTDVGGNCEVVEDGVTGFVAPATTVSAVSEALERAWSMRDAWPAMGEQAALRLRTLVPPDPAADFVEKLRQYL